MRTQPSSIRSPESDRAERQDEPHRVVWERLETEPRGGPLYHDIRPATRIGGVLLQALRLPESRTNHRPSSACTIHGRFSISARSTRAECFSTNAIASSIACTKGISSSAWSRMAALSVPSKRPAWIQASGKVAHYLQVRQQPRPDRVADQIRRTFFQIQRLGHAANVPGPVLDTDEYGAARRIGERHDRAQEPVGRGKVPFELQGLALGCAQCLGEVHYSEIYSEAL